MTHILVLMRASHIYMCVCVCVYVYKMRLLNKIQNIFT